MNIKYLSQIPFPRRRIVFHTVYQCYISQIYPAQPRCDLVDLTPSGRYNPLHRTCPSEGSSSFERGRLMSKLNGATSPINLSWDDPVSKIRVPWVSVTCFWERWYMHTDTRRPTRRCATRRDVYTYANTQCGIRYDICVQPGTSVYVRVVCALVRRSHDYLNITLRPCTHVYGMYSMVIAIFDTPPTKSENISSRRCSWHCTG